MRFTALDSWRGVCALMVALYHLPIDARALDWPIVRNAYLFVDFFFVLSGFVITHAYAARINDFGSACRFLLRRFGRLWPLHIATLGALVTIELAKYAAQLAGLWHGGAFLGGNDVWSILSNLVLIQAWNVHDGIYWNFPSWSISTEWAAYIAFVALILAASRSWVAGAIVACPLLTGIFIWLSPDTVDRTYDLGVLRCLASFALGMVTYAAFLRFRLPANLGTLLEALTFGLAVLSVAFLSGPATHVIPFVFAATIFVFAFAEGQISKLFETTAMRTLGDRSYSIYMNHMTMLLIAKIAIFAGAGIVVGNAVTLDGNHLEISNPIAANLTIVAYVAAVILVSGLTYRWIELPGQALFTQIGNRFTRPPDEPRPPEITPIAELFGKETP